MITELTFNIASNGVYDRSVTTKCSDKPPINPLAAFTKLKPNFDCLAHVYFKIAAGKCNCIPFSYRRQFYQIQIKSSYQNLRFCTAQIYVQCMENVQLAMAAQPNCLPPCVYNKNQYSLMTSFLQTTTTFGTTLAPRLKALLTFQCKDMVYSIHEEQFQLSPAQLLSQVGGDIGLYTGVSILGIWQFFIYAYNLYRQRKMGINLPSLANALACTPKGFNAGANGESNSVEERLKALENNLACTNEKLAKNIDEIKNLMQQIQRMSDK